MNSAKRTMVVGMGMLLLLGVPPVMDGFGALQRAEWLVDRGGEIDKGGVIEAVASSRRLLTFHSVLLLLTWAMATIVIFRHVARPLMRFRDHLFLEEERVRKALAALNESAGEPVEALGRREALNEQRDMLRRLDAVVADR